MSTETGELSFDIGMGSLAADAKIMQTGKVDLSVYFSPERFEREREIFGGVWLNIAEEREVPNAGDWIVREIKICSASVIIVRGKDMKVRAFHNVCAHRGMKVAWGNKGSGGKFACPYHAWVYDAQGDLLSLPDEKCFPDVNKKESGLTPVRCDIWEGFIFVNLDAGGTQTLAEYLGPVFDRVRGLPFASYPYAARVGATIDANWKLSVEAQCEAYHVRVLHSRTVSKMLSSRDNPYVHALDAQILGAHRMQSVPRNPDYEISPEKLVQAFSFTNVAPITAEAERGVGLNMSFAGHPYINKVQSNVWNNDQYVLFPNFIVHAAMGGWWLHRFWPLAADRTYWEGVWHFERPKSLRAVFAMEYALALNRDTLMEDNLALVQQQEVLASGAKKVAQFGEEEALCKHLAAVFEAATMARAA